MSIATPPASPVSSAAESQTANPASLVVMAPKSSPAAPDIAGSMSSVAGPNVNFASATIFLQRTSTSPAAASSSQSVSSPTEPSSACQPKNLWGGGSVDSPLISDSAATVVGPLNTASVESTRNRLACHTASSMSPALDQRVIKERVHALDEHLRSKQLTTRDVVRDGNCLFRCLSVGEYGHEERHSALRTEITNHMPSEMAANSSSDGSEILKYINSISRDCVWVSGDVIL